MEVSMERWVEGFSREGHLRKVSIDLCRGFHGALQCLTTVILVVSVEAVGILV